MVHAREAALVFYWQQLLNSSAHMPNKPPCVWPGFSQVFWEVGSFITGPSSLLSVFLFRRWIGDALLLVWATLVFLPEKEHTYSLTAGSKVSNGWLKAFDLECLAPPCSVSGQQASYKLLSGVGPLFTILLPVTRELLVRGGSQWDKTI